ncbi:hypothetical protein FC65_GL000928 [Ligilactobacillus acidipiscis DSM 15836]|uniref:Uncharacterized protein n=1 Tax=Ligilactobacillus acidipiscis DSM 15836 TaxID=1423716 RepID=A0ABR5PHK2_9LACO|nr:hypothetical protein FC65_GL000928 [Ligilactobacillus acidipiscis DSM 15836]
MVVYQPFERLTETCSVPLKPALAQIDVGLRSSNWHPAQEVGIGRTSADEQ